MTAILQVRLFSVRHALANRRCTSPRRCCRLVSVSRSRHQRTVTAYFSLAFASPVAAIGLASFSDVPVSGVSPLSTALTTVVAAVLAFGLARYLEANPTSEEGALPECPRCEGTGFEPCPICTRWSDGDVGCSCCRGTGRSVCSSCGGGGKAQPILQEVRREDS